MTNVSATLLDTMTHMIADSLIHDTKICGEGHGVELWRNVNARWHGRSDQVLQAILRAYITPTRCSTPLQLWDELPSWEQKAAELALANQPVSDMLKAQALLDLVPDSLRRDITGRPELAAYEPRLRFVKDQMEYARGAAQAQRAAALAKSLHSFAVGEEHDWLNLDWNDFATVQSTLYALTEGKGKGGKGGGKSGGKCTNRDGSAFAGECYHCGEVGHRKFECPKADDGKPDKGKAKGKGGKGKDGKGKGKTLDSANIEAATGETGTVTLPSEEEMWWLGAQYCLTREAVDEGLCVPASPAPPASPASEIL